MRVCHTVYLAVEIDLEYPFQESQQYFFDCNDRCKLNCGCLTRKSNALRVVAYLLQNSAAEVGIVTSSGRWKGYFERLACRHGFPVHWSWLGYLFR